MICVVMNTDNMALSEYTNYDFIGFANVRGKSLALNKDGNIYETGGDTDNGVDINAVFETGLDDLGENKTKRLMGVVVGLKSDGELQYRANRVDGYGEYFSIPSTEENITETRKLPSEKTKLSRTIGIEMSNVDGSDFSIDNIQLFTTLSVRRSGGV